MSDFYQQILEQLSQQSKLELVAVILAVGYVWLAAKQSIWCWPCALFSTGIYTWLFWEVMLPFNSALNAYYLVMAVYGWFQWHEDKGSNLDIVQWSGRKQLYSIIGLTIISLILSHFASMWLDSNFVYLDAFVTVFSIFATVLVAHKVLENWLYWIVINCFASYLYFAKDMYLTGVLFFVYIGFAVVGYFGWKRSYDQRPFTAVVE